MARPKSMLILPMLAGLLTLSACGDTVRERAATGALGGAVVAGPPGALVGGAIGVVSE